MKIAFILKAFPLLSETFILNQITGLIDRGHHVDIYAMKPGNAEKVHAEVARYDLLKRTRYLSVIPRSYFVRLGRAMALCVRNIRYLNPSVLFRTLNVRRYGRAASSLSLLFEAMPFLKERRYDIIHCQFGTIAPRILQLMQIGAVSGRLITSFRGYDATQYLNKRPGIYDELFRKADLLLPVSAFLAGRLVAAGCPAEKIRVHHSGIDCSTFTFTAKRPVGAEPTRLISVARLCEKKGIAYALRAVARIRASGRRLSYTVVGDGPLRIGLQKLIEELKIGGDVKLVGWKARDEVISLMKDAHVLLAPSITSAEGDQEGIPNVLKEAMALGMPVISTRHSGIPELVEDGLTGYLVPERDVDALTDRLAFVMDNPGIWPELGHHGRKCVETRYDIQKLNDRMVEIYHQLSTGSSVSFTEEITDLVTD